MLRLSLTAPPDAPLRVLCLGAHPDDLEIGCSGTVLWLLSQLAVEVSWVVFSGDGKRRREAEASAAALLAGAQARVIQMHGFRDGFFPAAFEGVKETFEALKRGPDPHLILTHHLEDRHQDHRTVADLTWNTFRDHLILEYEIPKFDGDLGRPNCYVPLAPEIVERKLAHLRTAFPSQAGKDWYGEDTFRGLLRLRGLECRAASGFAEAFHGRKTVLDAVRRP